MNMRKIQSIALIGVSSALVSTTAVAQSFGVFVETDQIKDAAGEFVNFGALAEGSPVSAFFGVIPADFDWGFDRPLLTPTVDQIKAPLELIDWTPMIDGSPAGTQWMSGLVLLPIEIGQTAVVAFMNVAGPGSLVPGSQVAVAQGAAFLSNLDNRIMTIGSGNLFPVIGDSGSLQMVVAVPEPSHFALGLGVLGLGFVLWRRRR